MLPLLDMGLAVSARSGAGKSPFHPTACTCTTGCWPLGHSHRRAVVIMYVWTAVFAFGAAALVVVPWQTVLAGLGVAVVVSIMLTLGPLRVARAWRPATSSPGGQPRMSTPEPTHDVEPGESSLRTRPPYVPEHVSKEIFQVGAARDPRAARRPRRARGRRRATGVRYARGVGGGSRRRPRRCSSPASTIASMLYTADKSPNTMMARPHGGVDRQDGRARGRPRAARAG